jgi:RNA polymerase sigma factor for flagellar operon FliA
MLREVECTTSGDSVCKRLDDADEMRWVRTIVTTLPRQTRRVIHLYDYEEHELKEVAMILGLSEARVSQIRSRAIRKLKNRTQRQAA